MLTALEIHTNPRDLEFTIGKDKQSGKFAFEIFRGPGHQYKALLTTKPFAKSQDEVIATIKEILEGITELSEKELPNPDSPISQILNPDNQEIDPSNTLNQEFIDQIIEELRRNQKASTCEMFALTG